MAETVTEEMRTGWPKLERESPNKRAEITQGREAKTRRRETRFDGPKLRWRGQAETRRENPKRGARVMG